MEFKVFVIRESNGRFRQHKVDNITKQYTIVQVELR